MYMIHVFEPQRDMIVSNILRRHQNGPYLLLSILNHKNYQYFLYIYISMNSKWLGTRYFPISKGPDCSMFRDVYLPWYSSDHNIFGTIWKLIFCTTRFTIELLNILKIECTHMRFCVMVATPLTEVWRFNQRHSRGTPMLYKGET